MNLPDFLTTRRKTENLAQNKLKNSNKSQKRFNMEKRLFSKGPSSQGNIKINLNTKNKLGAKGVFLKQNKKSLKEKLKKKQTPSAGFFIKCKKSSSTKNKQDLFKQKKMSFKVIRTDEKKRIELFFNKPKKSKKTKGIERSIEKALKSKRNRKLDIGSPKTNECTKTRSFDNKKKKAKVYTMSRNFACTEDLVNPELKEKLKNLENKLYTKLSANRHSLKLFQLDKKRA